MKFIIYDKSREESQVPWTGKRLIIGRRSDAEIRVDEPTMSGIHAQIFRASDGIRIRDLDSLNGTQVNGVRVIESLLRPGDEIKIGRAMIVVSGTATLPKNLLAESSSHLSNGGSSSGPPLSTQTMKISLDQLRQQPGESLPVRTEYDRPLLLLWKLFEALELAEAREDVLRKVRNVLQQVFQRSRVFILHPCSEHEWHDPDALSVRVEGEVRKPSLTFATEAMRSNSAILSSSLPEDQRFSSSESARISGIATAIAAPITCDGEPLVVIYVDRLGLPAFSKRDLNILGIAANHVTTVLERMSRVDAVHRTNEALTQARENLAEMNRNLEQLVEERTKEIRLQANEISRLAKAKDELLGIAAHDIRGPLTVIQGTSELLRLRVSELDPVTLKRSLDLMHGACRGLTKLLSELLDAKAIEAGKITLRTRAISVRELIESSLPVARLAADDKNIDLVIEAGDDLLIQADLQRLSQAVTNLVLNAVKFSSSGTRILLRGVADGNGMALIQVEDQGIGIPKDEIDEIFGTFEQGSAGKEFGGSGLGLMIARRIVDLHNGSLSVQSTIGVGTRFTLTLPRHISHAGPTPSETALDSAISSV